MKKLSYFFLMLTISNCLLASSQKDKNIKAPIKQKAEENVGLSFAFKPAYFYPQDSVYRDIYKGGFIALFDMNYQFYEGLGLWTQVGYFHKRELVKSINALYPTSVTQYPVSFGLSYTWKICSFFDFFFRLAPNWVYTKTWVDIPNLKSPVSENTFGATLGLSGKFNFSTGFFLELFIDYLYDHKKIKDKNSLETFRRYLGGIHTGLGIGYSF